MALSLGKRIADICGLAALALAVPALAAAAEPAPWLPASAQALQAADDDSARHSADPNFFGEMEVAEAHFTENGFAWDLIRYRNPAKPVGPLWVVPHDDENAAFDAMIAALKEYGGVGVAVNSGPSSERMQPGHGPCGVRNGTVSRCDPNRNFDARAPRFAAAFLDQRPAGQPVIALHTNRAGFAGDGQGGAGNITVLDPAAFQRGRIAPRSSALLAVSPQPDMANYDTFGLAPFPARAGRPGEADERCGRAISGSGISFWHERVDRSDGSLSNYLALNRPDIPYFNAESRAEADAAIAAARHRLMIAAYLQHCSVSQPPPRPNASAPNSSAPRGN